MDISLSILILLSFIFIIIGAILMLLLQYYIYIKFSLLPEPTAEQNAFNTKYSLPATLSATARNLQIRPSSSTMDTLDSTLAAVATTTTTMATTNIINSIQTATVQKQDVDALSLMSLSFIMQFLFHELKNSNHVRKWFYRKLSLELDELITKTTTGKLFDKLTIKQLELGEQFPEIKTLKVFNIELDNNGGRIENLEILMELQYNGNFRTSIDADMVLGKKGSLTLRVKQLAGVARLQFTRNPYTHWSLSFLGDPELDLDIESKYQGRQMQSNITSLISNQIRKAIRRKHTLPNYKIRYKPFFHKIIENDDAMDNDIQPNGVLEVKLSEITRLACPSRLTDIYCTLTMASVAFVEARQHDHRHVLVSLDVKIHKAKNQQIGIIFKQSTVTTVEIEAILPNTPAIKSNLKLGDILLAIEGKRLATIQQVAKVIKSVQNNIITLRINRIMPGIIRNDAILEDLDLYEDLSDNYIGCGNVAASISENTEIITQQTASRGSPLQVEKATSSESSLGNTPTNSPKKGKLIAKALKKTISRDFGDSHYVTHKSKSKSPTKFSTSPKNTTKVLIENIINATTSTTTDAGLSNSSSVHDVEHYFQHSTIDCKLAPMIYMEDLCQFKLNSNCRYLNVCVYGKNLDENLLLGFTNISINQILTECSETSLSHNLKIYELNPPLMQNLKNHNLASQSGFNPNLCFGDILFTFSWDGNPNISMQQENILKQGNRFKAKSITSLDKTDDSGYSDTISLKSIETLSTYTRSHNFIRTHFQRATQCDFCGKKIWLKDAVQCRDCYMCCHKKCINKCQNATVCGPVDCNLAVAPMNIVTTTITTTKTAAVTATATATTTFSPPEFMVTEPQSPTHICNKMPAITTAATTTTSTSSYLEVQRSNLTNMLNQNIKRVNSFNNLNMPALENIIDSLSDTKRRDNCNSPATALTVFTKSLPPTPQHSPSSRKSSLIPITTSDNIVFDMITKNLEMLPNDVNSLTPSHTYTIIELLEGFTKHEDALTMAKEAGKALYSDLTPTLRVEKINALLVKLRFIMDNKALITGNISGIERTATINKPIEDQGQIMTAVSTSSSLSTYNPIKNLGNLDENIQALSVIMLYLCTGLQHAQNMATQ